MSLIAIGYTIICAVSAFAAPTFIDDWNVNIPPGLSRAGFENWAANHAQPVICSLPHNGHIPPSAGCADLPTWSKSAITPARPEPARLEFLAARIGRQVYSGYAGIVRRPAISLMIKAGLWIELQTAAWFIIGLGLASLMGQRTGPVILLLVLELILTPILSAVDIPHLQDLPHSIIGLALARLEPSALPIAAALPGITGGVGLARTALPGRVGHCGHRRDHHLAGGLDDPRRLANDDQRRLTQDRLARSRTPADSRRRRSSRRPRRCPPNRLPAHLHRTRGPVKLCAGGWEARLPASFLASPAVRHSRGVRCPGPRGLG